MLNVATEEMIKNKKSLLRSASPQTKQRFIQLMDISGIAMSLILPIGIIPRIMQTQELNQVHEKIANQMPSVSVTHVTEAPSQQKLRLPGTREGIVETP